jgi:hypothetical protein
MFRISVGVCAFFGLACFVLPMAAQQSAVPPITGTGTPNHITKWITTTQLGNSGIFETTGSEVGIGTITPAAKLDLNGTGDVRDTLTLFPKSTHPTLSIHGTAFAVSSTGKVTFVAGQTFPGAGTVTSVGSGAGLTGGPITTSGTLSIDGEGWHRFERRRSCSARRQRYPQQCGDPRRGCCGRHHEHRRPASDPGHRYHSRTGVGPY